MMVSLCMIALHGKVSLVIWKSVPYMGPISHM